MSRNRVILAGDAPLDLMVYTPDSKQSLCKPKQRIRWLRGGVYLISDLLRTSQPHLQIILPLASSEEGDDSESSSRYILHLALRDSLQDSTPHYIFERPTALQRQAKWFYPNHSQHGAAAREIMVLLDTEDGLYDTKEAIAFFMQHRPTLALYHMARPLGSGALWDVVRFGPLGSDQNQDPMKLIVIVTADDLRAEGVDLSIGLSWERTCEDFVLNMGSNGRLDTILTCAHLIVLFGCDGAIYHRGRGADKQVLFFDPLRVEGDYAKQHRGWVPGITETFIAGMTARLAQNSCDELDGAILLGLEATRRLMKYGFKSRSPDAFPSYPLNEVMSGRDREKTFLSINIPSEEICGGTNPHWTILELTASNPVEVAREIVRTGPFKLSPRVPLAQLGRLILYDRKEIEHFRSIYNVIQEYLTSQPEKPLNIAMFGRKGCGKSYAAMELADAACCHRRTKRLLFNLAEFVEPDDLLKAFHSIRDSTLAGDLTIVYFKSVDSIFHDESLGWVPYLSSCMRSGMFLDNGHMRRIGPAILIFGTSLASFEDFGKNTKISMPGLPKTAARQSDFLSFLHGYIDLRGPGRCDSFDNLYPVRRAAILREMLLERAPSLMVGDRIYIDEGILDGLLLVSTLRHGATSMNSILQMSKLNQRTEFGQTALPSAAQLSLHVDYEEFTKCVNFQTLPGNLRELLAESIHETYRQYRLNMAKSSAERAAISQEDSLAEWNSLGEDFRESARAQADDIPRKLRLLSCFLGWSRDDRIPVREFTEAEVDLLGEQEHERWNSERFKGRWRLGAKNHQKRSSPFLVPWRDLAPVWKELDRSLVRSYPAILPEGYCIYRSDD